MKFCPKCQKEKSRNEFYENVRRKDGLRAWCKTCCNEDSKEREPKYKKYRGQYARSEQGKKVRRQIHQKYYDTIKGRLQQIFNDMRRRCNNPNCHAFKNYGGRGIQNKFKTLKDFRDYVMGELGADPRGLQIDRIDNDGHYERGNIRFVTCTENLNNRRNTARC